MHTAKAGFGMGSFGSPCFFIFRRIPLLTFCFFRYFRKKPLETAGQISYNTQVYAFYIMLRILPIG